VKRLAIVATLGAVAAVPGPAAAAGCESIGFKSSGATVRNADYLEWPPGHFRSLKVGDPVDSDTLESFKTYYVPGGGKLVFQSLGTKYTVAASTVFVPQCDHGRWNPRLLRGTVDVDGPRFGGNRPRSTMNSPEAQYMPLPGKPHYSVTRHLGKTKAKSFAVLRTARDSSSVWARMNGQMLFSNKTIPCQVGHGVKIYDDGRTESA
jgi:hypothetical protein